MGYQTSLGPIRSTSSEIVQWLKDRQTYLKMNSAALGSIHVEKEGVIVYDGPEPKFYTLTDYLLIVPEPKKARGYFQTAD